MEQKKTATEDLDRDMPKLSLHWIFTYVDYYDRSLRLGRPYTFRHFKREKRVGTKTATDIFKRFAALLGEPLMGVVTKEPPGPRRMAEYVPTPEKRRTIDAARGDSIAVSPYFERVKTESQRSFTVNERGADVALFGHVVRVMWKSLLEADRNAFRASSLAALHAFAHTPEGVLGVKADFRFPNFGVEKSPDEASATDGTGSLD